MPTALVQGRIAVQYTDLLKKYLKDMETRQNRQVHCLQTCNRIFLPVIISSNNIVV